MGRSATPCTGYRKGAPAPRSGCGSLERVSATMRNSASALNTISLDSADGPCLKKGGGLRSRVPNGTARSLAGEDRAQALHALEGDAATAHDASQRVFGHQHGQARFLGEQAVQ